MTTDARERFFETAPVGMYRSTVDGRFVVVNPALCQLLGYDDPGAVLALDLARDVYADPAERPRLVARTLAGESIEGVDVRWRTRGGRELIVRLYARPVPHDRTRGAGPEFDVTVFDVTELHAARDGLRAQRDELEHAATTLGLLLGQLPAVLWTTDGELRVTSSGGAMGELLGSSANRTVGMTLFDYYQTTDPAHPVIALHRRALAGEVVAFEQPVNGRVLAARLGPRRGEDGAVVGTIGTAIDITTTRELERKMAEAQRAERLGVLAGGLAHDFNNLLVAILGNVELALRDPPGCRDLLANIRVAAMRAGELTQQLLAYAGADRRAVAPVALGPVVDELLALLRPTTPREVGLRAELDADLPPVRADASQLRQVVLNLVANARDAVSARGGEVRVAARAVEHDGGASPDDVVTPAPGAYVVIAVADDGAGVDPGTRQRIFDPFFTTKPAGHGLGLAAVLGIVRDHGGGLRVCSPPGGGARFEVWWPAAARESSRLPTPVPTPVLNVLVIDDDDMVRDVVSRMLEDLGYAVIAVAEGADALAVADRGEVPLDAALLDLTMPAMSGHSVLAGLRARRPELPVIVCSGYDRARDGATDGSAFLRKPFRMEELERVLSEVTRAAR